LVIIPEARDNVFELVSVNWGPLSVDGAWQDAGFLIPVLSSLSKDEVLPVFPRLVDLPPDKFQAALARILQGSAHTGPALTPAEVLIALHGIDPHRDSVSLKKVMDACSACLQQRTVFTQQVLAKVLNQLVWSCTCVWCLGSQKSLNGALVCIKFCVNGYLDFLHSAIPVLHENSDTFWLIVCLSRPVPELSWFILDLTARLLSLWSGGIECAFESSLLKLTTFSHAYLAKLAVFFSSLIEKDRKKVYCILALKVLHVGSLISSSVLVWIFPLSFTFSSFVWGWFPLFDARWSVFVMLLNLKYL
jgi:hypothetical protein